MSASHSTPALESFRKSIEESVPVRTARDAMTRDLLNAHFQPIVDLRSGAIVAHESLIRGHTATHLNRLKRSSPRRGPRV